MSPCEGCTCGGGSCQNGETPKPRPGSLPWLLLVLLVLFGAAALWQGLIRPAIAQAPAATAHPQPITPRQEDGKPVFEKKSKEELKQLLTPEQYRVTQENGTERPFTNIYDQHFEPGIYVDITTGEPLFISTDKFDAGCGWPAFSKPISEDLIAELPDNSYGYMRTEVRSKLGDAHLGHVFEDGPKELGGLRYCINSASLRFIPKADMEKEGYGAYLVLLP